MFMYVQPHHIIQPDALKIVLQAPGIQCQLCHMTFENQSAINAHYVTAHTHHGDGKYECNMCGRKFTDRSNMRRHMSTIHGVGNVKIFKCDVCSRVFNRKYSLQGHMKRAHKTVLSDPSLFGQ